MSPWLIAERERVRTQPTQGVAHRIAGGDNPLMAWRVETGLTIRKLDRLTGICCDDLCRMEIGQLQPTDAEIEALAKALRVVPDLIRRKA
ncbi:helix-turn-helix domain-containing protein [Sphingomonas sp. ASY06-1R]|uniref:helix-turn-helix domain-containing protein n=1 Tax=Sphingomonas sp. ASY06-1R TaxID=3445771 RepID=UPI003FA1B092